MKIKYTHYHLRLEHGTWKQILYTEEVPYVSWEIKRSKNTTIVVCYEEFL